MIDAETATVILRLYCRPPEHKRCTCCRFVLPLSDFHCVQNRKGGGSIYQSWCKQCKQIQVKWLKRSRRVSPGKPGKEYRGWLGSKSPLAKLHEDDVRLIKQIGYALTAKQLGEKFEVTPHCIRKIRSGCTWSHVA